MTQDDDDAFWDKKTVCALTTLSKTHIDRLEALGKFPRRFQISGNHRNSRVGWKRQTVREWLRNRR